MEGTKAGEDYAVQQAQAVDYVNGRKQVREKYFSEPVKFQDQFSQRKPEGMFAGLERSLELFADVRSDRGPHDGGRCEEKGREQAAFERGRQEGYKAGYQKTYNQAYRAAYDQAYHQGFRQGCGEERFRARAEYNRGYDDGYDSGFKSGYDRGYNDTFRAAYDAEFAPASEAAYNDTYQSAYYRHYEAGREAGYNERYNEMYQSTFQPAKQARFEELYPELAKEQFAKGQADEELDFVNRPLRLLQAVLQDKNKDGKPQTGESLRITFVARNFLPAGIDKKDVTLEVTSDKIPVTYLKLPKEVLAKSLREKSVTKVTDALEFIFSSKAKGQKVKIRFTLKLKGKIMGEETLELLPL